MRIRSLCATVLLLSAASLTFAADTSGMVKSDREFVQMAADANARELQLSMRAREKAQSEAVRSFAARMVEEHGKKGEELATAMRRMTESGGPPLKRQDRSVRAVVDELNKIEGAEFDRRYMEVMVKEHQQAVRLYEREAKSGKDPLLKELAQQSLPELRRHLQAAQTIVAEMR